MRRIFCIVLLSTLSTTVSAQTTSNIIKNSLDDRLDFYVQRFNLKALKKPQGKNDQLFRLGRELFFEKELSGNRNISCATCHSPKNQGVDWLALSIGEGAHGEALDRTFEGGVVLKRNAPHVFNIDTDSNFQMMFWDARVRYNKERHSFTTPLEIFNGSNPKRSDITSVLTSAASMQALFPILSREEMRGQKGENELAEFDDVEKIFTAIEKRIFEGVKKQQYETMFQYAYPRVPAHKLNIGHIMEAIAHFEKYRFSVTETPWDQYLRGDLKAMSDKEKSGALAFIEKGMCIRCHNGDQLGGGEIHNIGVPSVWFDKEFSDKGLEEATGNDNHRFMFKTPSLRNVAFTFPYMHNGVFFTLEEVVEHYDDVRASARKLDLNIFLNGLFSKNYSQNFVLTNNNSEILQRLSGKLPTRAGLMTKQEKEDLVLFLRESLSEPFWDN